MPAAMNEDGTFKVFNEMKPCPRADSKGKNMPIVTMKPLRLELGGALKLRALKIRGTLRRPSTERR
ncbi:hypothetical protein PSAB6_640025 [Paraburkholderia sabiae]|nr:hypothetical protein PSAB6_640025 [Paraburkholderia sabiae]